MSRRPTRHSNGHAHNGVGPRAAVALAHVLLAAVCEHVGVPAARVRGSGRDRRTTLARTVYARLGLEVYRLEGPLLARALCKDTSAIYHARTRAARDARVWGSLEVRRVRRAAARDVRAFLHYTPR